MKKLLTYHDTEYFDVYKEDQFLYNNGFQLKVGKVVFSKGWWFVSKAFHINAITTQCVSFSELKGKKVSLGESHGRMGNFGINDTPFVYVYWTMVPKNVPYPYALPNNFSLKYE